MIDRVERTLNKKQNDENSRKSSDLYRWINPSFLGSFTHVDQIPEPKDRSGKPLVEIALIGRSNAGKSSLINALSGIKQLAKSSKTPGKTKTHNLFVINSWLSLMDLPGYGYAQVSKDERIEWSAVIPLYVAKRPHLRGIILVMDSRRELTEDEISILELAAEHGVTHIDIVLTKTDKLSTTERKNCERAMLNAISSLQKSIPALRSLIIRPYFVSSSTGIGIGALRDALISTYSKMI